MEKISNNFLRSTIGAGTGFNVEEQIFPSNDAANEMEQVQHRIALFQHPDPRIEKFDSEYSNAIVLDETSADQPVNEEHLFPKLQWIVDKHVADEEEKIGQAAEDAQRDKEEAAAVSSPLYHFHCFIFILRSIFR